jgi:hypothetical protein
MLQDLKCKVRAFRAWNADPRQDKDSLQRN